MDDIKIIFIKLEISNRKNKKYKMNFYILVNNELKKIKTTHFGDNRYQDFTTHNDIKRKERYLNRHRKNENWNNFFSAGSLSRYILWNDLTLKDSLSDYIKRFNLKLIA
jgi:hypothetical protein